MSRKKTIWDKDVDISNNTIDLTVISVEFVAQRIPLFEHFTSNTCGPCASFNPGFQTLLDANNVNDMSNAKVGAIKYQVNWPGSADQSFNADIGSRVSYYNGPEVFWFPPTIVTIAGWQQHL